MTSLTTLPERIGHAAGRGTGCIIFVGSGPEQRVAWAELHEEARAVAAGLQARGITAGSHVAILGPTTRTLVTAIQACWLVGATVVVLPLPMRLGSLDEFILQTRLRVHGADSDMVLVDADLSAFLEPLPGDPPAVLLDDVTGRAADFVPPEVGPDDLAVLQFTSGSTADPKGVMLPHRTILANLDAAAAAVGFDADQDVVVSWLPLYHDMGLIGLLTLPMITGAGLVLGAPQDFMAAPARWMQWISDYGGTATAGPNFSYALAARALGRMSGLDLSRWRIALNGAEPVDPATVEAFCAAAVPHGFDPGAAFPAFGMAELAIAGAFPEPGAGLRLDTVDRATLERENLAVPVAPADGADDAGEPGESEEQVRRLPVLGRPVPGLEFRICEPESGAVLGDRQVGELEIRGTSVTPGYYKRPDATAEVFHDGWLRTGDLAYLVDRELVLCGRIKDMIIVGGRNVYPEDVERAVAEVAGVRAGNVIAFGVLGRKGKEALIVVAEVKTDDAEPVRQAVAERVVNAVGLPAGDVVLVTAGTIPKTSSGKLQRSLCRARYLEEELAVVG